MPSSNTLAGEVRLRLEQKAFRDETSDDDGGKVVLGGVWQDKAKCWMDDVADSLRKW